MRHRVFVTRLAFVMFAAVLAGTVTASADPPETSSSRFAQAPATPRAIYRFDIAVRRPDDAPNARLPIYTINVEENGSGALSIGTNIPLVSSAGSGVVSPRQDVGLTFHFSYVLRGNVVVLTGSAEMSTAETSPGSAATIHRIRADGVVPLTAGRPSLFASIADITTRRAYEITITATRVL